MEIDKKTAIKLNKSLPQNKPIKEILNDEKERYYCYKKDKNWYCKICKKMQ